MSYDRPVTDDAPLSWPALLAAWTDFARASVAFPKDAEGDRWRAAVPGIIDLQAAACALGELHRLPEGHAAAAVDTAEVLISRRTRELRDLWDSKPPEGVVEVILDAHSAAAAARAELS